MLQPYGILASILAVRGPTTLQSVGRIFVKRTFDDRSESRLVR